MTLPGIGPSCRRHLVSIPGIGPPGRRHLVPIPGIKTPGRRRDVSFPGIGLSRRRCLVSILGIETLGRRQDISISGIKTSRRKMPSPSPVSPDFIGLQGVKDPWLATSAGMAPWQVDGPNSHLRPGDPGPAGEPTGARSAAPGPAYTARQPPRARLRARRGRPRPTGGDPLIRRRRLPPPLRRIAVALWWDLKAR